MPSPAAHTQIALIAAFDRNFVIGHDNRMPWHLPEDLKRFRRLTMGHPIIMGRKTFESIGRPLPGRTNIVISRDARNQPEGCRVAPSLEHALRIADAPRAFVIGGGEIYRLALPCADCLYLTIIDAAFPGTTTFPAIDWQEWEEVDREANVHPGPPPLAYAFVTYRRRRRAHERTQQNSPV